MHISGAKFDEHCFNISGDILDSEFNNNYCLRSLLSIHCASLLCIILCGITEHTLKNGGFFLVAERHHGGKSPFSRKQVG